MAQKLLKVFDKNGKKEVKKIKMVTTGEKGIVDLVARNVSPNVVLRNPNIEVLDNVAKVLQPKTLPSRLIPDEEMKVRLQINGDFSIEDSIKFTYDYMKVEVL